MSKEFPAAKPEPQNGTSRYRGGRPCFICGDKGRCAHREPQVERAELWYPPVDLAELRALVLAIAKEKG